MSYTSHISTVGDQRILYNLVGSGLNHYTLMWKPLITI